MMEPAPTQQSEAERQQTIVSALIVEETPEQVIQSRLYEPHSPALSGGSHISSFLAQPPEPQHAYHSQLGTSESHLLPSVAASAPQSPKSTMPASNSVAVSGSAAGARRPGEVTLLQATVTDEDLNSWPLPPNWRRSFDITTRRTFYIGMASNLLRHVAHVSASFQIRS
jgi:hypothetical protein